MGSRVNFASLDPVAKDERLRNLANLGRVLRKESQNKTNLVNREKAENARLLAENARLQALLVAADARFEDKFNLPSSSADLMRQIASANAVFKKKGSPPPPSPPSCPLLASACGCVALPRPG